MEMITSDEITAVREQQVERTAATVHSVGAFPLELSCIDVKNRDHNFKGFFIVFGWIRKQKIKLDRSGRPKYTA